MNQEMLQKWLNLPKANWPPDPWTLLGLTQDVKDLTTIEQRVQDRLNKLRNYQLSYPDEATEGMNRLAEAFVALTETCSRSADSSPHKPSQNGTPVSNDETSISNQTKTDWRDEPPPVRADETETARTSVDVQVAVAKPAVVAQPFVPPVRVPHGELDPVVARELAQESQEATHNLATIDAVIERVDMTRVLLHAWERLGRHLNNRTKRVTPKESEAYLTRLSEIADAFSAYPAFIGHPGIPGYRVAVLTRLRIPLGSVRAMAKDQRDTLLFDWRAGRTVLLTHRKYLRKLLHRMRRRTYVGLAWHAARAKMNDHPRMTTCAVLAVLLIAAFVGLAIAWR